MDRLSASLERYHVKALQEIADTLDVRPDHRPVRKSWLVGELSRVIPRAAKSKTVIQSLSAAERGALALILNQSTTDSVTPQQIAPSMILAGLARTEDESTPPSLPSVREIILLLMRRGLVINTSEPVNYQNLRRLQVVRRIGIAPEVRTVLPTALLTPPIPQPAVARLEALPPFNVATGDITRPLRELFFTWAELRQHPVKQLKAGGIGKRDRRRLAGALGLEGDAGLDHITWLHGMLQSMGLVAVHEGTIKAVESSAAVLFWSTKPVGQLPNLLQGYSQMTTEIAEIPTSGPIFRYFGGLTLKHAGQIRNRVVEMLGQVAGIGWLPVSLFQTLLTGGDLGALALNDLTQSAVLSSLGLYQDRYQHELGKNLRAIEKRITVSTLEELRALGVVDLGYTTDGDHQTRGRILVLRASPLTRDYYTNRTSSDVTSEEPWQVILQPDFQLLALGPVPVGILMNLEQFAQREKIDDSVITYRLTRDKVYWALQRGETVTAMLGYLEEATGQPAPQNIQRSLEEWSRQFERIVVRRQVSILQVDTPELLQQLLDDPDLGSLLHHLDACTAWFYPRDEQAVQARFLQLEMLPAHSGGTTNDLRDSVRWCDEELLSRAPVPSIYVTGALRRFADPHNGGWRVTEESTQRAVAAGMGALDIIDLLREMTGEELADEWAKRIQAWSSHYGAVQLAQVRLLRFHRQGALMELRKADPMLHRWLRPLPGSEDLAVIDERHIDDASRLLGEWGVSVSEQRWW